MYLETMQEVLSKSEKIIIDEKSGGSGVVPYLALPELRKRATTPPAPAAGAGQ